MRTIELAPPVWTDYFATVALEDAGALTQVQAVSDARPPHAGVAIARPLRDISFDGDRHLIELSVGGASADRPAVRYFVDDPRRVIAIEAADARTILVLDTHGLRTLVRLVRQANEPPDRLRSRSPHLSDSTRNLARGRRGACRPGQSRSRSASPARRLSMSLTPYSKRSGPRVGS